MRHLLRTLLNRWNRWISPPPPDNTKDRELQIAQRMLAEARVAEDDNRRAYMERVGELIEARAIAGAGPWTVGPGAIHQVDRIISEARSRFGQESIALRESGISAQGMFGDIELALQNVDWRRDQTLSWMEFSRWGIQSIILITRLYYLKNPIIRRLIDVCAAYVFARGVEVSCNDEKANEVLKDFFERNKGTLGQNALTELERRKDYDGNLFFVFFPDKANRGAVTVRTIDATEVQEIIADPEDADTPWFYRRLWTSKPFTPQTGQSGTTSQQAWYPALGYEPKGADRPLEIAGHPVMWDSPVLHRKCGGVAKWQFGLPRLYPALPWAQESKKFLESCANVRAALSQIALTMKTKGGQQAIAGVKQAFGSSVGPTSNLLDQNPPALSGSMFASGPGTTLEAFKTSGAGIDPEGVRQYKLQCCMVSGVPETFLGDVSTGNLATATSLDRPTETVFLEKQESWREDLLTIASYVLKVSQGAPSGKLREAASLKVVECRRVLQPNGKWIYEAFQPKEEAIELRVNFPAIREGDIPSLVTATVQAMTLGTQDPAAGIDRKAGTRKLYDLLGVENGDELAEEQFPDATYDPDLTGETDEPAPMSPADVAKLNEAMRRFQAKLLKNGDVHEVHG